MLSQQIFTIIIHIQRQNHYFTFKSLQGIMYNKGMQLGLDQGMQNEDICRKMYITYPTYAFEGDYELEFEITNEISLEFDLPITAIQIAGSAKTGYSYYQSRGFVKGESDLDVAIIDPFLFQAYCEIVMHETKGLKDLTKFRRTEENNNYKSYIKYIANGYFRPDLMPACEPRKQWFNYFNKLSQKYVAHFSDINAGIYFSQTFFEYKQSENIEIFKGNKL